MIVKHRRGTTQEWLDVDLIPKEGELVIEECLDGTLKCKIGTGADRFSALPYIDDKTKSILLQEINAAKTDANCKISELEESLLENINDVEQTLTKSIATTSENLTKDYIARDTALHAEISEELAALMLEHNTDVAALEKADSDNKANTDAALTELSTQLSEAEVEFNTKLETTAAEFDSKLSDAATGLTSAIESLEERILGGGDADLGHDSSRPTLIGLKEQIEELQTATDENLATLNQELSENVESLRSITNLKFMDVEEDIEQLENELKSFDPEISNKFDEFREEMTSNKTNTDEALSSLNEQLTSANEHITANTEEIAVQALRISNIIAPKPSTLTTDEELIDIRVGYNGVDHASAGDAVRAIGKDLDELKDSLPSYIPSNAVDGLLYENNQLWLTSKDETVGDPVTITGGTGSGSVSTVKVKNNLASSTFTISKGTEAWIDFTYTSFEDEVPTGDGVYTISINNKNIEKLSGSIQHGVAKSINVAEYLKSGSNGVKVTCSDQYGVSRSLVYTFNLIELVVESSFNSTQIFNDTITFRYTVTGKIAKTVYVLVDGDPISTKELSANVSGNEITLLIPKQSHGCHKIKLYATATLDDGTAVPSNVLEYEIICIEADNNIAVLASVYETEEISQGDLVSIPFTLYDPSQINSNIDLIVYSQVAGSLTEIDRKTITVDRTQQFWNTRSYPTGIAVFTISYTYNLYGVETTITKSHTIKVEPLDVDVAPEEDSLQLYLSAQGRTNREPNPAAWTFTQAPNGNITYDTITTSFEGFNWTSNGWLPDSVGDTCLRLNGDARAIINFKPFKEDFKANGKTIEFEFVVRDVNNRAAIVIDCFDGVRGFRATPDTAFLKSSGTEVSCRYKDEERVRVAITVEHVETTSRFVSIYLDGVLSGVQQYTDTDIFSQDNPLTITLGSSLCGLDIYNIRVYGKALSTQAILKNYIADQTVPTTRLQLLTNNDILDDNGNVSYDRVKALGQIPIITFTGPMPTYKGDKKKKTTRMKFEDPAHPEMNFDVLLDQIDVQGTSSQFYIRKNWKVKLPEARAHMPGAIPAKVYCIKVDYAEATGTHNTGIANYVETLYDREEVTLPPQKDDTRVRTTIQGFPVILFEKETEDSDPVFSSKGNFNYDKDAENAFGFTEDYKSYGVECWEFCNNTSDPVNFAGELASDWLEDFEPRYVPKSANFERIEELKEIEELAASGKGTMTNAQREELATLMARCIANFKEMHDWVLSTATYMLIDGKKVPITPTSLEAPVTYGETTYTEDNEEYRLAKFKYEFTDHFNMHYSSMYYVFTLFALMTDQRAKNLFLTRWKDDDGVYRWYPYFYDNDTIFGINNEGALVFDYFHEDTDQLGSSNVFNGQNSVLWHNFRLCFPAEIEEMYAWLRSSEKLTYNKIIDQFVTQGSDKYSEAIYNADADYKYVSMARGHIDHTDKDGNQVTGIDASNLYQVRGTGEQHLKYFVDNRLNYCDSKWAAGDYPSNFFFLRIYTPSTSIPADTTLTDEELLELYGEEQVRIYKSLRAVPASPNIEVTPFSSMYAGVRYKSGTLQQQRLSAGEEYTFRPLNPNETFGDTETAIYGASELASLGDLSGLYCGVINLKGQNTGNANATQGVVKENKLVELIIGNENPDYYNDNFREIAVGTCKLLKTIDLRNCTGLGIAGENPQKTLDLSGCPNIEHIYTEGTNLTSISLPSSGYIKTLHLPESISTLVITNQQNITNFKIANDNYSNIRTLRIENSNLNTNEILDACRNDDGRYTVERVRLTDVVWGSAEQPLENADFVKSLFPVFDLDGKLISGIRGIDDKNNPLDDAYLVGTCYIASLTGEEYADIKSHYPYLNIEFGEMTSTVTFKYTDADNIDHIEELVVTGYNSQLGSVATFKPNHTPHCTENDAFTYEFIGWSRRQQVSSGVTDTEEDYKEFLQADALFGIAGNRNLYPVFKAIRKQYEVKFVNDNKVIYSVNVPYGSDAEYVGPEPIKQDTSSHWRYEFTKWEPGTEDIKGPRTCVAQFTFKDNEWYTIGVGDISDGYILDTNNKTMSITKYNNTFNIAIKIPNELSFESGTFIITQLGGLSQHTELDLVSLPTSLKEILSSCFYGCTSLSEISLPESLQTIGQSAFQSCIKLKTIYIPALVTSIGESAFADCSGLTSLSVSEDNPKYIIKQNCLVDTYSGKVLKGLTNGEIPHDGSIHSLGKRCFASTGITYSVIPEGISEIPDNAFSNCSALVSVSLPSTVKTLNATCFAWCRKLTDINLPEGLTFISTYVFSECSLPDVILPASIRSISSVAFGNMTSLKSVTFTRAEDGTVVIPGISHEAFVNSGPILFTLPWTKDQHCSDNTFAGTYEDFAGVQHDKDIFFGAKVGSILRFIDAEGNITAELEKTAWGVQENV